MEMVSTVQSYAWLHFQHKKCITVLSIPELCTEPGGKQRLPQAQVVQRFRLSCCLLRCGKRYFFINHFEMFVLLTFVFFFQSTVTRFVSGQLAMESQ